MSVRFVVRGCALALTALLVSSVTVGAQAGSSNATIKLAKIAIPGNPMKSFDISWVDAATGKYYIADRSNGAIDVVNIDTNTLVAQIGGFVGFKGSNATSGPAGVVVIRSGKELWAGDGDSTAKVVDLTTNTIVASISTGGKKRVDEMAYDPKDNLVVEGNNADDPAFVAFISVGSRKMVGKIEFPDATDGVEQPWYDADTGMIFLAVPGTKQNEGGEIDVIDPVNMNISTRYLLTDCAPHGLATGPGSQLLAGCNNPNRSVIINKWNGKVLADFTDVGGSDEVWYNAGENRYYLASSSAQTLGVIDAGTMRTAGNVQAGLSSHSVAADWVTNHIFVPVAAPDPACPMGCIAVYASVNGDRTGATR